MIDFWLPFITSVFFGWLILPSGYHWFTSRWPDVAVAVSCYAGSAVTMLAAAITYRRCIAGRSWNTALAFLVGVVSWLPGLVCLLVLCALAEKDDQSLLSIVVVISVLILVAIGVCVLRKHTSMTYLSRRKSIFDPENNPDNGSGINSPPVAPEKEKP